MGRHPLGLVLAGFLAGVGASAIALAAAAHASAALRDQLDRAVGRGAEAALPAYFWPALIAMLGGLALAGAVFLCAPAPRRARAVGEAEPPLEEASDAEDRREEWLILKAPDLALLGVGLRRGVGENQIRP
jgi:hypothetical protein